MANRTFEIINGNVVDVTTVFDKTVTTTTTEAQYLHNREVARELLDKYFPNQIETFAGFDVIWDRWKAQKGWIISAFQKHPCYNGNFQIVLKDQDMIREINKGGVINFLDWFYDQCRETRRYKLKNGMVVARGKAWELKRDYKDRMERGIESLLYLREYYENVDVTVKLKDLEWRSDVHQFDIAEEIFNDKCEFVMESLNRLESWVYDTETPQTADEDLIDRLNKVAADYPSIKFRVDVGQKVSRIVGKLGKISGIDKITNIVNENFLDADGNPHTRTRDYGWNGKYAAFTNAINPLVTKGTAVISVNPIDYWTMSFGHYWESCHTIDKLNRRDTDGEHNYSGMYCGGTESYMGDNATIIFYFLPNNYDGDTPELQDKRKRCCFHLGEDKMIQGRVYPDARDGGDPSVGADMREIMQNLVSELFDVPNLWKLKKGITACEDVTISYGPHYRDYLNYDDCNVSFLRRIDGYINKNRVTIGSEIICPECGEFHSTKNTIFCRNHKEMWIECSGCGELVRVNDAYNYARGEYYCDDCAPSCYHCGDRFLSESESITHIDHYDRNVCWWCLENRYTWSEEEGDYIHESDLITTEEGSQFYESSNDRYGVCSECGEYHDRDNMREIDERMYCERCAEDLEENQVEAIDVDEDAE